MMSEEQSRDMFLSTSHGMLSIIYSPSFTLKIYTMKTFHKFVQAALKDGAKFNLDKDEISDYIYMLLVDHLYWEQYDNLLYVNDDLPF